MTAIDDLSVGFDRAGSHLTIYLAGELDCANVDDLASRIAPHIHPTDHLVWVDLAAVTFCGSAGITLFIQLHNLVTDHGGRFTLYRPSPAVMRTISLCQLDQVLSVSQPLVAPAD